MRTGTSRAAIVLLVAALIAFIGGLGFAASWLGDRARLREVAEQAAAGATSVEERITRVNSWVYRNQGFEKNKSYFLWKRLDATPIDVLEKGGDCEDKSKLTIALLEHLGIRSTFLMLFNCAEVCDPVHTVVMAETPRGWTVVDPVYDIDFPNPEGGLITIEELRADPSLLQWRLDELVMQRGPWDKINRYKRRLEVYDNVTTLNWDKNGATRAVAKLIEVGGGTPWKTPRPFVLDDPKRFFAALSFAATIGLAALAALLAWRAGRRPRVPAGGAAAPMPAE